MDKTIETLYSIQNLYFLLIICGSIFLAYIVSIIISSASNIVEERNPHLVWLFDIISAPLLMFIMNIGYGFVFNFLNIPSKSGLEPSITIVLAINVGILAANLVPFILIKSIKAKDNFSLSSCTCCCAHFSLLNKK